MARKVAKLSSTMVASTTFPGIGEHILSFAKLEISRVLWPTFVRKSVNKEHII